MFASLRLQEYQRTCIDYPSSTYKLVPRCKLIDRDDSAEDGLDLHFQVERVTCRDSEDFEDTHRRTPKTWFLPQMLTSRSEQPQANFNLDLRESYVARSVIEVLHRIMRSKSWPAAGFVDPTMRS